MCSKSNFADKVCEILQRVEVDPTNMTMFVYYSVRSKIDQPKFTVKWQDGNYY